MDLSLMQRPAIPREYYDSSLGWVIVFFLFSIGFILIFGSLGIAIAKSDLALWLKVLLCLPCVIFASHGFHLVAWFAHEGIHLNLATNKYVSIVVGILVSAITLFPAMGYGINHWNHHRFTNQESDPETQIYPKLRTFWSRFFLARLTAQRGYVKASFALMLGRPLEKGYRLPFTDTEQRIFATLTLANMGLWIGIYATIAYKDPVAGLMGVILPLMVSIPTTGLRIYLEHSGTGAGIMKDTRSYAAPLYTFFMFGNNLHLEHHLYPKVPCYNLAKVHRYLSSQGYYDRWGSHIERGILAPLRFLGSRYQYPNPQTVNLKADPWDVLKT